MLYMDSGNKKYTVKIQDPATNMLIYHTRFLAQVSESAAQRLVEEFYSKAKTLEYMPERCPWLTDDIIPRNKYRKLVFNKRYMLVFQVKGDKVYIDAIVDCRQDYSWLLHYT